MLREQVRRIFKDAIKNVYKGSIITSRVSDERKLDEGLKIFISESEVTQNFSCIEYETLLAIQYFKKGGSDFELDQVADTIIGFIPQAYDIAQVFRNPVLERIEYDDEDPETPAITLTYKLIY